MGSDWGQTPNLRDPVVDSSMPRSPYTLAPPVARSHGSVTIPSAQLPRPHVSSEVRISLDIRTRLGPYEIESLIGIGGMGEVYRARDTQLKREVALKVLPAPVG